jgi:E3 ubiquitin-protein ligase RNF19A
MKEVDNLHFITPTGCTFYGKNRWSKSKSILFLVLSWILTPIIALILIVLAIPVLLIVLPIILTKKFYRYSLETEIGPIRRFILCTFVFLCTFLLTPFLLILCLLIGVPLLLFFIYFYMPKRYISANF